MFIHQLFDGCSITYVEALPAPAEHGHSLRQPRHTSRRDAAGGGAVLRKAEPEERVL